MPAADILTVTLNPALDLGTATEAVVPGVKLRCAAPEAEPGGGGVNVSRAIHQLGGASRAAVALAGPIGARLADLLAGQGLSVLPIAGPGETRMSFSVSDAGGAQYRFVLPGPVWDGAALEAAARQIADAGGAWIVLSGSMPPGAPAGWATDLAAALRPDQALVVDTSGAALTFLAQGQHPAPAILRMDSEEAEILAGQPLPDRRDTAAFADTLRQRGAAERVVIARGADGSVLAGPEGLWHSSAAGVAVRSAIGAGDSFVGGMVRALADGHPAPEALRHGAAAASAAVMTPGTQLCHAGDFAACLPRCVLTRL